VNDEIGVKTLKSLKNERVGEALGPYCPPKDENPLLGPF
jgi:hypothetical protein